MKKIIAVILAIVFIFSLTGCSAVNDKPVAVLWSGEEKAVNPNSLINSMDRAMYIENIAYEYYGAKGDVRVQLDQAKEAIKGGCSILMVELVHDKIAQEITDLARDKDIPVIFFGCEVDTAAVETYDKCIVVNTDETTLAKVQGEMITKYFESNAKEGIERFDHNKDGKITYAKMSELDVEVKAKGIKFEEAFYDENMDPKKYEMILTDSDLTAFNGLQKLQKLGYNTDKLSTHFVPIFTVGDTVDYKNYVLATAPEDKEKAKKYYEEKKYLVDLTNVEEDDIKQMIYTTTNVIDSGRICGTVIEDYDGIAVAVAAVARNIFEGKNATQGIKNAKDKYVKISYKSYSVS